MTTFCPAASDVLELGCGTGTFAHELREIWPYGYMATDGSGDMIRAAEAKAVDSSIQFMVADMRAFSLGRLFDVALLLYDGINYLLDDDDVVNALAGVRRHLHRDGIFIFDQSTPSNSLNNRDFFEDSGGSGDVEFVRTSRYDEQTGLHHTTFEIAIGGSSYSEHHIQRAYSLAEMSEVVAGTAWHVEATYDGFTHDPATEASERVQWILRAR
jgi:SAM-dependent methyltransferase